MNSIINRAFYTLKPMIPRGFEVGVHGLNNDGKLFSSQKVFQQSAKK